jgi:hypothetical protein
MGMFDTFIVDQVTCPHCNKIHTDFPVQSKSFECMLDTYKEGDVVSSTCTEGSFVESLYRCPSCEENMGDIRLYISDGVFTGTKRLKKREVEETLKTRVRFLNDECDNLNRLLWDIKKTIALKKHEGLVKRSQLHYIPSIFGEDEFNKEDVISLIEELIEDAGYEVLN